MAINFEEAIKQSIMIPFRDSELIFIIALRALVYFAVGIAIGYYFISSFSVFLSGFGSSTFSQFAYGFLTNILLVGLGVGVMYLVFEPIFVGMIMAKAYGGKKLGIRGALDCAINRYLPTLGGFIP